MRILTTDETERLNKINNLLERIKVLKKDCEAQGLTDCLDSLKDCERRLLTMKKLI
jgi:hypothetical protein